MLGLDRIFVIRDHDSTDFQGNVLLQEKRCNGKILPNAYFLNILFFLADTTRTNIASQFLHLPCDKIECRIFSPVLKSNFSNHHNHQNSSNYKVGHRGFHFSRKGALKAPKRFFRCFASTCGIRKQRGFNDSFDLLIRRSKTP